MKHLPKMLSLPTEEITDILNTVDQLKYKERHDIPHPRLAGKMLRIIFQKASARTHVSFETGIYRLGGYPLFLSPSDLQIGRGEPVQDIARMLSRYLGDIMIRTYEQSEMEALAKYGLIPVISGLTDFAHPCQVPVDLMTIREARDQLDDLKMCLIGDGNNMLNSLVIGGLKMGMKVLAACPKGYEPGARVLEFTEGNPNFFLADKPEEAVAGADVVITDVQSSMGMEMEKEKHQRDLTRYQINSENLKLAAPETVVLHYLPAHRGEEITEKVFETHTDEVFKEAENRLRAQKAVLVKLLG